MDRRSAAHAWVFRVPATSPPALPSAHWLTGAATQSRADMLKLEWNGLEARRAERPNGPQQSSAEWGGVGGVEKGHAAWRRRRLCGAWACGDANGGMM
jgi:hypothetical protein